MARSQIIDSKGRSLDLTASGALPVAIQGEGINLGDVTIENIQAKTEDITFHNAATSAGNGTELTVGAYKDLTIEIYGNASSKTVVFEAAGASGNYIPVMGIRNNDFQTGTSTSENGSWTIGITGQKKVRIRITAVSGGDVTVKGTAVA